MPSTALTNSRNYVSQAQAVTTIAVDSRRSAWRSAVASGDRTLIRTTMAEFTTIKGIERALSEAHKRLMRIT